MGGYYLYLIQNGDSPRPIYVRIVDEGQGIIATKSGLLFAIQDKQFAIK